MIVRQGFVLHFHRRVPCQLVFLPHIIVAEGNRVLRLFPLGVQPQNLLFQIADLACHRFFPLEEALVLGIQLLLFGQCRRELFPQLFLILIRLDDRLFDLVDLGGLRFDLRLGVFHLRQQLFLCLFVLRQLRADSCEVFLQKCCPLLGRGLFHFNLGHIPRRRAFHVGLLVEGLLQLFVAFCQLLLQFGDLGQPLVIVLFPAADAQQLTFHRTAFLLQRPVHLLAFLQALSRLFELQLCRIFRQCRFLQPVSIFLLVVFQKRCRRVDFVQPFGQLVPLLL